MFLWNDAHYDAALPSVRVLRSART